MPEDSSASNFFSATADHPSNGTATGIALSADGPLKEISGADDKELSMVAKRFLVAEINRLVEENQQLKLTKDKYHDVDKRLAVLKETLRPFRINELLSSVCLIAGSAGLGAAPSFLSLNSYGWYVFVSVSALLVITGIAARVSGPSTAAARQPGASSK
jgi:hypothetical protein